MQEYLGLSQKIDMYRVTAYFRNSTITRLFVNMYDAIDFRDTVDAHYPNKVKFEQEFNMRETVYDSWNGIMNANVNPLRHIPDLQVRHMVLQVLAWMWCIVFSMWVGSFWVMGISMIAHALILAAIVVTVATFEVAKNKPELFKLRTDGYHSVSRNRSYVIYHDDRGHPQKIYMDKNDPGGEHE